MNSRMMNSTFNNHNNPSIHAPTDSKLKTFNSLDDHSEYYNDIDPIANQLHRIATWAKLNSTIHHKFISPAEHHSTALTNCYLVIIEQISSIYYKKSKDSNRLYLNICLNLYSPQNMAYSGRTLALNLAELENISSSLYKASDNGMAIYFHCKAGSEQNLKLKVEMEVMESEIYRDGIEVMSSRTYLGYVNLDPFKGVKSKQKEVVFSPKLDANIQTNIQYTVTISDSFKILQKLIPPNCLCGPQDTIPGLAGRKLPSNIGILYNQIQYTELQSMKIDITSLDIHDTLIKQKLRETEETIRNRFWDIQSISSLVRQYSLEIIFHNGWTAVNKTSVKLLDKMEIQKKTFNKRNKEGHVSKTAEYYKIKHFSCEEIATLPFVFVDDEAVIILQINAKIEIKTKSRSSQQTQTMNIPLNYSLYPIDRLNIDEKQVRTLHAGEAVYCDTSNVLDGQNITGKIQFYAHLQNINKVQMTKNAIVSNQSFVNKSQLQVDKILLEKQRMIKENKKLKQQNRAKKIELNQQIPLLDTTAYKQVLYKDQIERIREERKEKEEMLQFLKKKINQINPAASFEYSDADSENSFIGNDNVAEKRFQNKKYAQNFHQSIFYKNALKQQNKFLKNYYPGKIDLIKIHKFLPNDMNPLFHCQVPLDIIKTELLQQNYSYAVFVNCLSLVPISQNILLPRKFMFQISFFKERNLRSCLCEVNQTTGEILSIIEESSKKQIEDQKKKEQKQTAKIIYVEVGPRNDVQNNSQNLIDFIGYLYYGYLQVKIIDSASGLQFGQSFLKMKDLIRMRRNQVTVMREVWVKNSGQSRGLLKMQVRCIRKESCGASFSNLVENKASQGVMIPTQMRQLEKIAKYKARRQGNQSSQEPKEQDIKLKHINKILDEEFTKSQIKLGVSRMKPQLVKIEITNRKNQAETYHLVMNDPDKGFMENDELIFVNELFLKTVEETAWWRYMYGLGVISSQNIKIVDENNCFELVPGETGVVWMYYYSQRKFCDQNYSAFITKGQTPHQDHQNYSFEFLIKIFNRPRCIQVSASNKQTGQLHSLHKVYIIPQPNFQTYQYQFVRKASDKVSIQIPVPNSIDYVLYIDDPTVISTQDQAHSQNGHSYISLDCYAGEMNEIKKIQVSLLSPYPENKILINYCFSLWGAHQIYLQAGLWQAKQVLVQVHTALCRQNNVEYLLALCEDESVVCVRDKNPIKVNVRQSKTFIRTIVTAKSIGVNHYCLNIVSPIDYRILSRYSFKVETPQPSLQQKMTLRIKLSDKILEQPFCFKNDMSKKVKLRAYSTKPHILWCVMEVIEVEARGEKQIKIKINAQLVWDQEIVILSLIGDKVRYNYMFILQLDKMV